MSGPLAGRGSTQPPPPISTAALCLTRIQADVGGGTGRQEGYRDRPAQGLLIIEDFKLIHVGVAKELTSQGVLVPSQGQESYSEGSREEEKWMPSFPSYSSTWPPHRDGAAGML